MVTPTFQSSFTCSLVLPLCREHPLLCFLSLNHCGLLDLYVFSVSQSIIIVIPWMLILSPSDWLLCPLAKALVVWMHHCFLAQKFVLGPLGVFPASDLKWFLWGALVSFGGGWHLGIIIWGLASFRPFRGTELHRHVPNKKNLISRRCFLHKLKLSFTP